MNTFTKDPVDVNGAATILRHGWGRNELEWSVHRGEMDGNGSGVAREKEWKVSQMPRRVAVTPVYDHAIS